MFGKESRINPLDSRKRLLIAESELNRVQLLQDWETVADGVRVLAHRAKSFGTISSATVSLAVGLAAFTRAKPAPPAVKLSWFQKVASGARLASTLWLLFRSRSSEAGKK